MKLRPFSALAALLVLAPAAVAQPAAPQVAAAFVLGLGRLPATAEVTTCAQAGATSAAQVMSRIEGELRSDPALRRATAVRACEDALGREPTPAELARAANNPATYTARVEAELHRLATDPARYERVMNRAYERVLGRAVYDTEITYWRSRPVLSFAMLTACVHDWARRNRPGLMATTGIPSASVNTPYLTTVKLLPAAAGDVQAAAGLSPAADPDLAEAAGRNVLAPGGAQVLSIGHIHFAAAGVPLAEIVSGS